MMNTFLMLFRLILVIGFLYIALSTRKYKSVQGRRLAFAFGGLFISGSYLIGLVTQETQSIACTKLVLWSLPGIGGILLMVIIFFPKLQENLFEYFAWSLIATWIISFTYRFNIPSWVEWSLAILAATLVLIMQLVKKQPAGQL